MSSNCLSDRVKLYNHDLLNPSKGPEALQRKVQFDLRFYFCRRGMENMDKMKKNDFELRFNTEAEEWFVVKVKDELTKNHKEIENIVSGIMPENKTDDMCPVKSFRKYIEQKTQKTTTCCSTHLIRSTLPDQIFGTPKGILEKILWLHLCLI